MGAIPLRSALLVEDNSLIALDIEEMLKLLGVAQVHHASTVGAALALLDTSICDFAILDIGLRQENSFPIATVLRAKAIPFLFVTGYGPETDTKEQLSSNVVLTKPLSLEALKEGLESLSFVSGSDRTTTAMQEGDPQNPHGATPIESAPAAHERTVAPLVFGILLSMIFLVYLFTAL